MRWSQRWLDRLEDPDPAAARRVARGRAYARAGRVTDVRVGNGTLSGRVHGSKATPYVVELEIATLSDDQWQAVVGMLAGQVRYSAQMLAGQVSEALERELDSRGVGLLPALGETTPTCPCADGYPWCAHATAVWAQAAELVAKDPLLLLRLRGRGRERLLAELAEARQQRPATSPGVPIDRLVPAGWTSLRAPLPEGTPDAPPDNADGQPPEPALRRLGDPPGWAGGVSAWDLLGPLVERAAAWARER